jgi:hypothetical protein
MKELFENFRKWSVSSPPKGLIKEAKVWSDEEAKQEISKQWEELDHILYGGPQGREEGLINDFRSMARPHHVADLHTRYGQPQSIVKRTLQTLTRYKNTDESIEYAADQISKLSDTISDTYLNTQREYAWAGQDQELLDRAKEKVVRMNQAVATWGGQNYRNATMALLRSGYLDNKYGTVMQEGGPGDTYGSEVEDRYNKSRKEDSLVEEYGDYLTELEEDPREVVTCKEFMQNEALEEKKKTAAWQRKAGKNKEGGLNAKGRKSYEKENPGSDLKAPVSAKQAKKSKGGKSAKRRKSFCARMCGMKKKNTGSKGKRDPDSRINKSLRKWDCNC